MQVLRECKFSNIKNFRTHSGLVFLCYLNFALSGIGLLLLDIVLD